MCVWWWWGGGGELDKQLKKKSHQVLITAFGFIGSPLFSWCQ